MEKVKAQQTNNSEYKKHQDLLALALALRQRKKRRRRRIKEEKKKRTNFNFFINNSNLLGRKKEKNVVTEWEPRIRGEERSAMSSTL